MKILIDFNELAYIENNNNFFVYLFYLFFRQLRKIVSAAQISPPFHYKNKRFSAVSYKELGKTIRFDNDVANKLLGEHIKRLELHNRLSWMVYYFIAIAFSAVLLLLVGFLSPVLGLRTLGQDAGSGFITFVASFFSAFLAMRIASVLVDKHFADTLALISAIYLIVFLEKEDSLTAPEVRRKILDRMRTLRKYIILLARTFVNEDEVWLYQHMRKIENFVHEREYWVIAPQQQTSHELRNDFSFLLDILASGQYGRFEWNKDEIIPEAQKPRPADGIWTKLVRVVLTITPFLLLTVLYFVPEKIVEIGIDTTTIFSICIVWILVVADSYLQLGIVDRASGLAKTMKDLR